jgi:hypothetical protein
MTLMTLFSAPPSKPARMDVLRSSCEHRDRAAARGAGVRLRLAGDCKVKVQASTPSEPLDRLCAYKLDLAALLRRDACRYCGEPMGWPQPVGAVFVDGTAAHRLCDEAAEVARIKPLAANALSPEAMNDPAEMMVHGKMI